MKYYIEQDLKDFKAWSGAKKTIEILEEIGKIKEVENYLEEIFSEASDTDINDFLWFETDFIFMELLGYTEEEMEELYK
jgi:hypothetical protein